jgi:hypothetical protein
LQRVAKGTGISPRCDSRFAYAQAIVSALGYDGEHLGLIEAG